MELPSMVERSGDRLVVRSLVSGAPLYQSSIEGGAGAVLPMSQSVQPLIGQDFLEQQLEQYKANNFMFPLSMAGFVSAVSGLRFAGYGVHAYDFAGLYQLSPNGATARRAPNQCPHTLVSDVQGIGISSSIGHFPPGRQARESADRQPEDGA